ncbi:glutamate receptor ionotropic, kainate 1-like [Lineus longissimus]|uniref:glutamate receptor ionotropic, kainate 1-like n=1 Tax=Lineus longissimus TaxID=88925 RepID=UPI00315D1AC7
MTCNLTVKNEVESQLVDAISTLAQVIHQVVTVHNISRHSQRPSCRTGRWPGVDLFEEAIKRVKVEGITGNISFDNSTNRRWGHGQEMFDLESSITDGANKTVYERVGTWSKEKGINVNDTLFLNEFKHFKNRTLIVATLPDPPFMIMNASTAKDDLVFTGFLADILHELSKRLNFSVRYVLPADKQYGSLNSDGSWTGMVGMVVRGEADIAVSPLTATAVRATAIDFTIPFMQDGLGIMTKKKNTQDKMFRLFKPFSPTVWILIAVSIVVVGVFQWLVNRSTPEGAQRRHEAVQGDELSLTENTWMIFGNFLGQASVTWYPVSSSGRTLFNLASFFSIMVMSFYTSDLIAYLAVPSKPDYIRNLRDLTSQTEIRPFVTYGTSTYDLFKESDPKSTYGKVYSMMEGMPRRPMAWGERLKLMNEGKWAWIGDKAFFEYLANTNCDKFTVGDQQFFTAGYGFALPKNSLFGEAINKIISQIQQAGFIVNWKKKWWEGGRCAAGKDGRTIKPLDLASVSGAFIVVACAIAVGALVLVGELLYNRFNRNKSESYEFRERGTNAETTGSVEERPQQSNAARS